MANGVGNNSDKPFRAWVLRIGALIALVALVFVERQYKSHPELFEHQLGNTGFALLMFGMGCFLLWQAVTGIRAGNISGNYTAMQYKRSENSIMFWFIVAFDAAAGAFLLVGAVCLLFGVANA